MESYKQSFTWWSFARGAVDRIELLRQAGRIGYRGVEMIGPELWPAAREAGLEIATLGGHKSIADGLNKRENHARIEDELLAQIDLARRERVAGLICFSGNRNGVDDSRGRDNTVEGLLRVNRAAEAAGVTLLLELLNSKVDHPGYQCDRSAWGVDVVRRVNSPRVKLLYDIYHMQIMEGDVIRTIRENIDWIGHFHVAGNPGRNAPDAEQELNYPAICKAIRQTGYAGFLGQEFLPKGEPAESLRRAFEICR